MFAQMEHFNYLETKTRPVWEFVFAIVLFFSTTVCLQWFERFCESVFDDFVSYRV